MIFAFCSLCQELFSLLIRLSQSDESQERRCIENGNRDGIAARNISIVGRNLPMAIGGLPYAPARSLDLAAVYRLSVWHGDRSSAKPLDHIHRRKRALMPDPAGRSENRNPLTVAVELYSLDTHTPAQRGFTQTASPPRARLLTTPSRPHTHPP